MNAYNSQFSAGQYFFDRVYTQGPDPSVTASNSGHGFASLLLGVPASGTLTFTPRMFLYQRYRAGYVHDDWRVTNRLTLNIGLRYEYTSPYAEKWGNIGQFDAFATEPITGTQGAFKWVPPGGYHTDPNYKTFSPRLGLAYMLNSKTVIRTGAAILNAANNGLNAAATDFGSGTFVSNFLSLGPPNPFRLLLRSADLGQIRSRPASLIRKKVRRRSQDRIFAWTFRTTLSPTSRIGTLAFSAR